MEKLTNAEMRKLKAQAQHLEPMFKVGKAGLSEAFLKTVDDGLTRRELVKIKFVEFKEEKKTLAPELAEKTSSHLITRVGNVVVLYRPKPAAVAASPAATVHKH
jgi:RNA-binding protein